MAVSYTTGIMTNVLTLALIEAPLEYILQFATPPITKITHVKTIDFESKEPPPAPIPMKINHCGYLQMPLQNFERVSQIFHGDHNGIDLVGPFNSPVLSAEDGVVASIGWENGYGTVIDIAHEDNIVTRYAHLRSVNPKLKIGTVVFIGQEIGREGMSGNATGPHLHFEVRINDTPFDPAPWLGIAKCNKDSK
jgi:murein DD-endopeptidase MepM/ murein hydrolase activator NlpD